MQVLKEASHYGESKVGEGKKVLVEFSSPNIAKPFHAGHLRTTIIGNFIRNLYKSQGYSTIAMNYLGDWGKQYGLLAVGFTRFGNEELLLQDPIKHLFEVYVKVSAAAEADSTLHDEARDYFRKMELGHEENLQLWRKFRDLSICKYKELYKRLNIEFDVYSGESFYEEGMKKSIERLKSHSLLEESKGAQIVDLSADKLGKAVIVKTDGATLYLTRDIAAAEGRFEEFKFDKMIYVIASEQDLHMKQLFKILSLMKFEWADRLEHINYGMVLGMSTRKGNVVFLEDIIEESKAQMHAVMKSNEAKYAQIENPDETAEILAMSAIIIQDMAARRIKDYTFSMERMTSFEGDTGPYLQYAHSRLCSVERKLGLESEVGLRLDSAIQQDSIESAVDFSLLTEPEALDLAFLLSRYPNVLSEALRSLEPCVLVTYLMSVSHAVSNAWEKLWVMGQEAQLQTARLALYRAARFTICNGLLILGIRPLERM